MKRRSSKQPTDKKPVVANSELWRKLTESSQATVSGGLGEDGDDEFVTTVGLDPDQ